PALIEAITRLQEALIPEEANLAEVPELTKQMVEDIIVILTTLDCKEPEKLLTTYAKQHSLEEFIAQLKLEIPDLAKLVDNQKYLLALLRQQQGNHQTSNPVAKLA